MLQCLYMKTRFVMLQMANKQLSEIRVSCRTIFLVALDLTLLLICISGSVTIN